MPPRGTPYKELNEILSTIVGLIFELNTSTIKYKLRYFQTKLNQKRTSNILWENHTILWRECRMLAVCGVYSSVIQWCMNGYERFSMNGYELFSMNNYEWFSMNGYERFSLNGYERFSTNSYERLFMNGYERTPIYVKPISWNKWWWNRIPVLK